MELKSGLGNRGSGSIMCLIMPPVFGVASGVGEPQFLDFHPFPYGGFVALKVDVGGVDIGLNLVVAPAVVAFNNGTDLGFTTALQIVVFQLHLMA